MSEIEVVLEGLDLTAARLAAVRRTVTDWLTRMPSPDGLEAAVPSHSAVTAIRRYVGALTAAVELMHRSVAEIETLVRAAGGAYTGAESSIVGGSR